MIKRVNFTGRRRIPRDRVAIAVLDGQPRTFDATIDLEGLSFLPHAAVYLEATCAGSTVVERFPFGEVGKIEPPINRTLVDLEGENVFFTLKVVDRTESVGRILGIANQIRPEHVGKQTDTGRRGILPIVPAPLGQEIWRLDLNGHDASLLINDDIPGLADRVRSDPLFYTVVYPIVVRSILTAAIDEGVDFEEDDDRWPVLWLRFGKELHPDKQKPPKREDTDEREEWIDEIAEAFCNAHMLRDKFSEATGGDGGDL